MYHLTAYIKFETFFTVAIQIYCNAITEQIDNNYTQCTGLKGKTEGYLTLSRNIKKDCMGTRDNI